MELEFIEFELCYSVREKGYTEENNKEKLGFIPKEAPTEELDRIFVVNKDFSGILEHNEMDQICDFMEKLE